MPPKSSWSTILGYSIATPIGVPACPLTATSKGVALLASLGFDVITYKTIRSHAHPAHPLPNIVYVNALRMLTPEHYQGAIKAQKEQPELVNKLTVANSFGNASNDVAATLEDIDRAVACLREGQLMLVSVFGQETRRRTQLDDFVYTACLARDAGAQAIEVSLSCPNIHGGKGLLYESSSTVFAIVRRVVKAVDVPVVVKLGYFRHAQEMERVICAIARAGAQGICGINSLPMHVIDKVGQPAFGKERSISGVSGSALYDLSRLFVQRVTRIIKGHELDLTLFATGGVMRPEQFDELLCEGANVVMSATGAIWNPYLAHQWRIAQL